jgi:hypothetical protein
LFCPGAVLRQAGGEKHLGILRVRPVGAVVAGGLSMVATTFSSDTPNWVTEQVRKFGVAGNWQWWAFVLTGVATVFFFARLWRRSGVMTDLEFYELRYSGRPASRWCAGSARSISGCFFNCFIMGDGDAGGVQDRQHPLRPAALADDRHLRRPQRGVRGARGLWGVLVIDMMQFFIKMTGRDCRGVTSDWSKSRGEPAPAKVPSAACGIWWTGWDRSR